MLICDLMTADACLRMATVLNLSQIKIKSSLRALSAIHRSQLFQIIIIEGRWHTVSLVSQYFIWKQPLRYLVLYTVM